MKVGIMQPYLFPYIGYFQLIANTNKWVFLDVVQYNKRSWMNRNRVLHPTKQDEYQYIGVPITKHRQGTLIKDVLINRTINWEQTIIGKLTIYKRMRAEYYDNILSLLAPIFERNSVTFLDLTVFSIKTILEYVNLEFSYRFASDIELDRSLIKEPGDWALSITKEIGGRAYINPLGGIDLFNEDKFMKHGIDLLFLNPHLSPYNQSKRNNFVPSLSIIDLLMFNAPETVRDMIMTDFSLYSKAQLKQKGIT